MRKLTFLVTGGRPGGRLGGWDEEVEPLLKAIDRRLPDSHPAHVIGSIPRGRLSVREQPVLRPGDAVLNVVGGEFVTVTVGENISAADIRAVVNESLREIGRDELRAELWED